MPSDSITILEVSPQYRAAKRFYRDSKGKIQKDSYEAGYLFNVVTKNVSSISELSSLLFFLAKHPTALVIRGEPIQNYTKPVRRLKIRQDGEGPYFKDAPEGHHWVLFDFDNVPLPPQYTLEQPENAIKHLVSLLPEPFHTVTVHWHLSASAGMSDTTKISSHLWYWFNSPVTDKQLKQLAINYKLPIDTSLFNTVQPHYTADPIFDNVSNPIPQRSGLLKKINNSVDISLLTFTPIELIDMEDTVLHTKIVNSLRQYPKDTELSGPIAALLKGEPFAQAPHRHSTILQITMHLARKFPIASNSLITNLFTPSLQAIKREQPNDPPKTIQEVLRAFEDAKKKIKESLGQSEHTYPQQTLERIAKIQNCTVSQLDQRWLIQKGGGGWILDQNGNYRGFFDRWDYPGAIRHYLARAPVELLQPTEKGYKRKSVEDLTASSGRIAEELVSDMSKQNTTFDPETGTLYEAVTPLRPLIPRFDPQIDTWLKLLFGKNYEKGLDWMAICADLTKQLCAIYFAGTKDSGKTLFALGMAKLWTEGAPADIMLVMGDFNEELIRCPLILADEELPQRYQKQSVTTKLRSMLSTTTRTLSRKFMHSARLEGAIRLVLTANNDFLLSTDELHTADDLDAIAQRFMYIKVSTKASKYLASLDRETTACWLERGIAEHALWLQQNREVQYSGNRFAVEGDIEEMHRRLLMGNPWSSLVCEWIVNYLMEPKAIDISHQGLVLRENGKLLLTTEVVVDTWINHVKDTRYKANPQKIGTALSTISVKDPIRIKDKGKRRRFREIEMEHVYYWINEYNIGDEETVRLNLNTSTKNEELQSPSRVPYDEDYN